MNAQNITVKEINSLKQRLDSLEKVMPALSKNVESIMNNATFPSFIKAIADVNKLNISVSPELNSILVNHNFPKSTIKNVLIFSAQKYNLDINVIGSIITINKKKAPAPKPKEVLISYDTAKKQISLDLKKNRLDVVFKKITQETGKNIFYEPILAERELTIYLENLPLKTALDQLALTSKLRVVKTKKGFYQFSDNADNSTSNSRNRRSFKSKNFYFKVVDTLNKIIDVNLNNVSIATVVNEIGLDLKANIFTTSALPTAETTSFKASNIHFDPLLNYIFETATNYSYKKENNIYFFGKNSQASVRNTVVIPLIHRTIQIMDEPKEDINSNNISNRNNYTNPTRSLSNGSRLTSRQYSNPNPSTIGKMGAVNSETEHQDLLNIIPEEIRDSLQIKSDVEHNSFIVSGTSQRIEKFRKFIKLIDKPVPVITIDVMILEVSNSASVSTGISLGIGDAPTTTKGGIYPSTSLTLGANSINKIIGGFKGFESLNLGKVTPNFYAKIEALETNGDLEIKSTPQLTALNGHEARLSNGERSYYVETITDIIGSQNPQTREIKNYIPVDANLAIKIRPIVSGDGQITLSIKVIQSSFNGKKIDPEAPPGINTREFTSTIRVKDQEVIILGGLEENLKNDSGSGIPFLARIPIIKYLFSKRTRTKSKMKLSVLIKPTIINK